MNAAPPSHPTPAHPLRVLDIINLSASADAMLKNRALAMRVRGMDNRIMCMPGPYVQSLRDRGVPTQAVNLPRAVAPFQMAVALFQMMAYMRRERIDLVHTHCSMPGILGRLAARLAGVPVIVHTIHGLHTTEGAGALLVRLYNWSERFVGSFTHLLLSQNRADLEVARRSRFTAPERMHLIGNGIDLTRFRPEPRIPDPDGVLTIHCTARLEPVKNHPMLFEALRRLLATGRKVRLRLVGDGELRQAYERRCAEMGIASAVEFLGYRDDMTRLLAQSDVAVLTSTKEGIPRAMMEAMAMKIPVVATRVIGTEETVVDGETGFLVPLDDVDALTDRLARLLDDPDLRRAMGERGRARVEAEFDENAIVDRLADAYRRLLATPGVKVPATMVGVAPR